MKFLIILTVSLIFVSASYARHGDGGSIGGACAMAHISGDGLSIFDKSSLFSVNVNQIVDIQTVDGDVVTIDDLKDGYFEIENSFIEEDELFFSKNAPVMDLQLDDGEVVDFQAMIAMAQESGEMGGGVK